MCLSACPGRTAASSPELGTKCESLECYLRHGIAGFGGWGEKQKCYWPVTAWEGPGCSFLTVPFGGPSSHLQWRVYSKLLVVMASTEVKGLVTLKPPCLSIWFWVSGDPVCMALMMGCGWHFGFASTAFLHVLTSMVKFSPGERQEGVGGLSEKV